MIARGWNRFWFAETPLTRLAIFRMLILAVAIWGAVGLGHEALSDARAVSAGSLPRPWQAIYLFEILGLRPIGLETAQWVYRVLIGACVCGIVGLFTRTACLVAMLGFFYWTGLVYSFGKPHHDKIALAFALVALPFAPVGARLSLDALLRRCWGMIFGKVREHRETSPWATFPLRLTQVTIALGYFFAGGSKLVLGGLEWMNGYTLQGGMLLFEAEWSALFAQNRWLCQILSIGFVPLQVTFPLVLVWPRLAWLYVPAMTAFHLTTWKTMHTGPYVCLWFTLSAFLPLESLCSYLRDALVRLPWAFKVLIGAVVAGFLWLTFWVFFAQLSWWALPLLAVPLAGMWVSGVGRRSLPAALEGSDRSEPRRAVRRERAS